MGSSNHGERAAQGGGGHAPWPPAWGYATRSSIPSFPILERRWAAHVLLGIIGLAMLGLIGRLAWIQNRMAPTLLAWAEPRQSSVVPLPGRRGAILDRRQRVLAGSHDRPTVYADPSMIELEKRAAVAEQLAGVLDMPVTQIRRLLDDPASERFVILKRNASRSEIEDLAPLKIPGLGLRNEPVRSYSMGTLAAHVFGFVGIDGSGLDGLEMALERSLQAKPGKRVVYRDVQRRALFQKPDSYVPPKDGAHVVLTLDAVIQEVLESQVREAVMKFRAESGTGLVMDPRTGEILALTCWPTFHPATAGRVNGDVRRNRLLTDPVEPGSIFKPFVMSAALAAGLTNPAEMIFCHNGLYATGKRRLHDHHAYGSLSVEQIMIKSSNIGMAILGQRLGNTRMYAALERFGFGKPTGIDLPGEGDGLLLPLRKWTSFSTTSVPMGHEMAMTPIQIAAAFAAICNGGRLLQPRVVAAVIDRDGSVIEDRSQIIDRGEALDAQTAAVMREILVKVVNEGTGRPCRLDRWQVLGKTGTAQIPRQGRRGYEPDAYLGSFMAAAPARDPAVLVLVMIRKPDRKLGYYGSTVAAPAVKAVLEESLTYLGVPPDPVTEDRARLASNRPGSNVLGD